MKHRKAANVPYPQNTSPGALCPLSNPHHPVYTKKAKAFTSKVSPPPCSQEVQQFNYTQCESDHSCMPASSPSHTLHHMYRCPPEHPQDAPPVPLCPPLWPSLPHGCHRPWCCGCLAHQLHPLHPGYTTGNPNKVCTCSAPAPLCSSLGSTTEVPPATSPFWVSLDSLKYTS